jgi:predicted transcriptional regulator
MWWFKRQHGSTKPALEQLGSLETGLMEQIWNLGETSVRNLHAKLSNRLAYTTIMTTLDRLYKKKMLDRRKVGKAYIYTAQLSEKEYRERVAQHLIGMALRDGQDNNAVLSCFVDVVSEADRQLLQQLEQLVKAKRRALSRPEAK